MQIFVQTMNGKTGDQLGEIQYAQLNSTGARNWLIKHCEWASNHGNVVVIGPRGKEERPFT